MYNKKYIRLFKTMAVLSFLAKINNVTSQSINHEENMSSQSKMIEKPKKIRQKPSYMSNPSMFARDITDSGFPDVIYPTSILDANEQFYFQSSGLDDVLRPFSDDVKASYKALNSDKKVQTKTTVENSMGNWKKPAVNKSALQELSTGSQDTTANELNNNKEEEISKVDRSMENPDNTTENIPEDPEVIDEAQLTKSLADHVEPNNESIESNAALSLHERILNNETSLSNNNESKPTIIDIGEHEHNPADSDLIKKLNQTRTFFDAIITSIENLHSYKNIPDDKIHDLISDNHVSRQNSSLLSLLEHENETATRKYEDTIKFDTSGKREINLDINSLEDSKNIPYAPIAGNVTNTELPNDILSELKKSKDIQSSRDSTNILVDPLELSSNNKHIENVGTPPATESIEIEEDDYNELSLKSSANSLYIFDGFKSAKYPFSVLFNFSSNES